jgi:hypothetical protein
MGFEIPVFTGHLVCLFVSTSYVMSLYLIPSRVRALPRDDPAHIKYRMLAASSSTLISGLELGLKLELGSEFILFLVLPLIINLSPNAKSNHIPKPNLIPDPILSLICYQNYNSWGFPDKISFLQACGFIFDTLPAVFFRTCFLMVRVRLRLGLF